MGRARTHFGHGDPDRRCGGLAVAGSNSECRFFARTVPDVENLDTPGRFGNVVKDAVRMEDNLAQGTSCASWIGRANEREGAENANVVENAAAHPMGCLRIVVRDVGADVLEVCNRRVGPDYLEVHAVAQDSTSCSTSSWLLERPAAMSARPRRMAAMRCNSSVISSREAPSGSLSRASITACLSVMGKGYRNVIRKARDA